ncbi:MAG: hypothetical protein N3A72_04270 [bacterium]|nr:hypothetical protein [bacterium]
MKNCRGFFIKSYIISICIIGLWGLSVITYAVNEPTKTEMNPAATDRVLQSYGKLPISFIENKGQIDTTVIYYVSNASGTMFFTKDAIVMEFIKREKPPELPSSDTTILIPLDRFERKPPSFSSSTVPIKETRLVLKKRFLGVDQKCEVVGEEELPGKVNILRGSDPSKWKQNLATFRQIRYKNLYSGIDVVYRGSEGKLEYIMYIACGKNPNQIKFIFEGADNIELSESGDLIIKTKLTDFIEKKPNAYQEKDGKKVNVISKFILEKNPFLRNCGINGYIIRVKIDNYDKNLPLIIE